ncbi:DUF3592 domain-containing protein [Kitasatospora sp. GP82]|uniref:DUF3592 domain-containing protein n=1 Tax=Kitasatospora sp. GP82 TaxID=3035089 RepID=UPI002475D163|nr:DUF3592 domain-containing protein [Kitasatospora sp. GP82]
MGPAYECDDFAAQPASPGRTRARRRALRTLVSLVGAVAFTVTGVVFDCTEVHLWLHYSGAQEVPAVVTAAEYAKPGEKEDPTSIRLLLTTSDGPLEATTDAPSSAPDGLSPGDHVRVLFDPARPGSAAFPAQLSWGAIAFPGAVFTVVGLGLAGQEAVLATRLFRHRRPT